MSRDKLLAELSDAVTSLRWQQSPEAATYYASRPAGTQDAHLAAARLKVQEIQHAFDSQ